MKEEKTAPRWGARIQIPINPKYGKEVKRMVKKYGLIGTILSISILLTLMILGPNAVAQTDIDGGHLLSQVQLGSPCTTNAVATQGPGASVPFIDNPVVVTVRYNLDNPCSGSSSHYFYLRVTNLDSRPPQTDDDELGLAYPAGPQDGSGTLSAQVDNGQPGHRIEIYIYVNVTHGMSFDDDDETWTITLTP